MTIESTGYAVGCNPGQPEITDEASYVRYQDFYNSAQLNCFPDRSFTIVLLDNGSGECRTDNTLFELQPKQLFIHLPDKTFDWSISPGSYGRRLLIESTLIETFTVPIRHTFSSLNKNIALHLDDEGYKRFSSEFDAIKKEIDSNIVFPELINARARLIALIVHVWKEYVHGNTEMSQGANLSNRFHSLVDKNFRSQKVVSFYAEELQITANYLGIICRKHYNKSPLEMIRERIVLEAKKLLHSSELSIKEIGYSLGYTNLSYFSFFFKGLTGMTPKEYRMKFSIQ